jgi:hypothetical protein
MTMRETASVVAMPPAVGAGFASDCTGIVASAGPEVGAGAVPAAAATGSGILRTLTPNRSARSD